MADPAPGDPLEARASTPHMGRAAWCAVLVSVCVPFVTAVVLAVTYHPVTQYDEQAHFDYVARLATEHRLFPVGEVYGEDSVREMRCRGIGMEPSGEPRKTCGPVLSPQELPFRGINYVASYSPVFYAATALVAAPLSSLTGMSLFLASRLACAVWFGAGAGVLALALIRLGVRPGLAAASTVLLASTPSFLLQGGAVTPDSVSLLAGAGALLILTLRTTWGRRLAVATVFGILMGLVKSSFAPLGTVGVLLCLLFPLRGPDGRGRWQRLSVRRAAGGLALSTLPVLASGLASAWRSTSLAPGGSSDGGMSEVLRTSRSLGTEIALGAIELMHPLTSVAYIAPAGWVLIATILQSVLLGAVAFIAVRPGRGVVRTLAVSAVGSWVLMAFFLSVTFYVLFHVQGTQGRYAMPVMPLFVAPLALALGGTRCVTAGACVAAAIAAVTALVAILTV